MTPDLQKRHVSNILRAKTLLKVFWNWHVEVIKDLLVKGTTITGAY